MDNPAAIFLTTAAPWSGQALPQAAAPISDTDLSKGVENPEHAIFSRRSTVVHRGFRHDRPQNQRGPGLLDKLA
jgi:hypothetical protein